MSDSNGMRVIDQMLIGYDVLQWSQAEPIERLQRARLGLAHECGWIGEFVGAHPNFGWEIAVNGAGLLRLRSENGGGPDNPYPIDRTRPPGPWLGVDRNGNVLELDPSGRLLDQADAEITVPNDGVWRTLTCSHNLTRREPGRLTLTGGSTAVVGVGTKFTRYNDATDPEATILRIDATDTSNGNDGSYQIDEVIDDENLVLVSPPPSSETGVNYRVKGQFFNGEPADPDIHNNVAARWTLGTRTTTRPTNSLIAYDIRRNGGVTQIIDRRRASLYQPYSGRSTSFGLTPAFLSWNEASDAAVLRRESVTMISGGAAGTKILGISMAPAATGSHMTGLATSQPTGLLMAALVDDGATRRIRVKAFTQVGAVAAGASGLAGTWDDPNGGTDTDVVIAAGLLDVALVALPAASGFTHACFYVDSAGDLFAKTTADNGANWVGPSTVWEPPGGSTILKVDVCLTRLNRLAVVVQYSAASRIRVIYSDDLGATWDLNGGGGYAVGDGTTIHDVSVCEDDRGNLWTVAAQGLTNVLRAYRGGAEGIATPDAVEVPTAGWPVGADDGTAFANRVSSFALPNGMIGAAFDLGTAVDDGKALHFMGIARNQAINHQQLAFSPSSTAAAVAVAVGVTASGVVHVGWSDVDVSNNARVNVLRYVPTAIERAHTWYGGS